MRFSFICLMAVLVLAGSVSAKEPEIAKDTFSIIHSRKSVRSFTGASVSRENLEKIIRAGMAAPTAVNKQPWSFVVVTEKKTINALAAGLPTARGIEKAGAVIIVCAEPEKAHMQSKDLAVVDASLASENILLATEALGLGGHWTASFPYEDKMKHVRTVLGIPANIIPLNVILVGVPTGEDKPKDKFQKDKIHWGKW
ncbi:nitroreductase family protein [Pelobacter propionicus]|uniref:Nitroreductase n=1 Tax=Pelobacter propionicus (strain DSM 2379 / NBRC 103807 / OttBd1) TaxID=338966 RepID=A1AQ53_PELPD|nr:nitroreductase family protein [Pelobacter propionicus]ABK99473.1 nitroreductase [Pelobacter propionicus DSM 2379]